MRLTEQYRPKTLADVVGQPVVQRHLMPLVRRPAASCWLLTGSGGTGKTSAAHAVAHELGVDPFYDFHEYPACDLTIDECRRLFTGTLRYRPLKGWKVLLVEELDRVASDAVLQFLKHHLEPKRMPERLIVLATSNDVSGLDAAFLQRWQVVQFADGVPFHQAIHARLRLLWAELSQAPLPPEARNWGRDGEGWSMRVALDELENHLSALVAEVAA